MNDAFFYIEVQVFNFSVSCKNHFGMNEFFFSFQCQFDGLNEITPCHDYLDILCKICHKRFCGGIFLLWILYWNSFVLIPSWNGLGFLQDLSQTFLLCNIFLGIPHRNYGGLIPSQKFVLALAKLKSLTFSPRSYPFSLIDILLFDWSLLKSNQP